MNQKELDLILENHKKLLEEGGGKKANLRGANLSEADLSGAKGIICIGPIGSRGDMLYARASLPDEEAGIKIKTGCFWGAIPEFEAAILKTHCDNAHAQAYRAALALVQIALAEPEPETAT